MNQPDQFCYLFVVSDNITISLSLSLSLCVLDKYFFLSPFFSFLVCVAIKEEVVV